MKPFWSGIRARSGTRKNCRGLSRAPEGVSKISRYVSVFLLPLAIGGRTGEKPGSHAFMTLLVRYQIRQITPARNVGQGIRDDTQGI